MKRCPQCRRDYYDETLLFCLEDGTALLQGSVPSPEEPPTAIFHATEQPGEAATRAQIQLTDETAVLPSGTIDAAKVRGFDRRLLAVPLVFALAVSGFFGYRYFAAAKTKQVESIAVMPFVNESGNADVEYLSDGMTETLINSLSQIPGLNVKARSSVFRYKGKEIDPKKIASDLGVQAVLTGRVAQRGDALTLNLELIDAQTENTLWGKRYERRSSELVSLQSEIARDVSTKLKSKLSGADAAKIEKAYTANPEAYQLFLKGRFQWNKRTSESLKQATEFYRQAIEQDPNYARAYAGLAETYVLFPLYSIALPNDCMPKAKAMALRALEIDDSMAEAHAALGSYLTYFEFDRVGAEKMYRRAIELNPNYATAHQWLGNNVLNPTKRFDEALAALRRAEELDPLSPIIGSNLGDSFVYTRRYDEAILQYRRVLAIDPNFAFAHFSLGWMYYVRGMHGDAIAEFTRSFQLNDDDNTKGFLAMSLAKAGRRDEALKLLDQLKKESSERYVSGIDIAVVYIGLNDREAALTWLEKGVEERSSYATFMAVDPVYDDLRGDPRFAALLKRMNLPE